MHYTNNDARAESMLASDLPSKESLSEAGAGEKAAPRGGDVHDNSPLLTLPMPDGRLTINPE